MESDLRVLDLNEPYSRLRSLLRLQVYGIPRYIPKSDEYPKKTSMIIERIVTRNFIVSYLPCKFQRCYLGIECEAVKKRF